MKSELDAVLGDYESVTARDFEFIAGLTGSGVVTNKAGNKLSNEIFKYKRDGELYEWNNQNIPKYHSERREIYDDNRYIYKFNGEYPRCVYGYLTNRNDKIEKVVGWVILSGKEYCKETPGVGTWM